LLITGRFIRIYPTVFNKTFFNTPSIHGYQQIRTRFILRSETGVDFLSKRIRISFSEIFINRFNRLRNTGKKDLRIFYLLFLYC